MLTVVDSGVVRFLWSLLAPLIFSVSFSMMNMHSSYNNYNKKKTKLSLKKRTY